MSWFTQYRPATIAELHSQLVKTSLENLLRGKSFPHALLFAGPKGTGKTSSARIIGALLNSPQNQTAVQQMLSPHNRKVVSLQDVDPADSMAQKIRQGNSYVVTEMDAASNRGIDDIRQLKERLLLPPQEGQVSVYILDEVHMLTNEAFNALLKVLEEPPTHVVFVLATTELHKVPPTVVSRCTLVQFQKASLTEIETALTGILKSEKIDFDPVAVTQIAQTADGSFRDAVKALETIAHDSSKVTQQQVQQLLVPTTPEDFEKLIQLVLDKKAGQVTAYFNQLRARNLDQKHFYTQLLNYLHTQLLASVDQQPAIANQKIILFLLQQLLELESRYQSEIPFLPVELKILELIFRSQDKSSSQSPPKPPARKKNSSTKTNFSAPVSANNLEANSLDTFSEEIETPVRSITISETQVVADQTAAGDGKQLVAQWGEFLEVLHQENISLELLLRSARPVSGQAGKATIEVFYQFHKEQLEQPKFNQLMQHVITKIVGAPVFLEFVVADKSQRPVIDANIQPVAESDLVQMAEEMLG